MSDIRKGDRVQHINGDWGTAHSGVERNSYGCPIVSVNPDDCPAAFPWNVTWIVAVERGGLELARQLELFEVDE